jgi:hypothetical protein
MAIIICCSFQTWCYDKKSVILQAMKTLKDIAKCKKTASTNNIPSMATIYNLPASETNSKFFEKKSLLIGAGQITLFALLTIAFLLPYYIVRRVAKQNVLLLNSGTGRIWVFLSQISLRFFYLNFFPAMVILSNSKMKRTIWRAIKNVIDNF